MDEHATRAMTAVVYAVDLAGVAEFYAAALGLERTEEADEFVALTRGQLELVVVQAQGVDSDGEHVRAETPIKLSFLVDDLEATRDRVLAAGGSLAPLEAAWNWAGARHLDGVDPEGNVIQLRCR